MNRFCLLMMTVVSSLLPVLATPLTWAQSSNSGAVLQVGASLSGSLTPEDEQLATDGSYFDRYSFEGTAGQQISLTMTSTEVDPYLILLGPEGNSLVQDDDGGGNLDARIVYTLPSDGRYTVYANTYGGEQVGTYRLSLETVTTTTAIAPPRRYFCDESAIPPVVRARRKDGAIGTLLVWDRVNLVPGTTALDQCRQVADRLDTIHNRLGRNFAITVGQIRNQPAVCAAMSRGVCDPAGLIFAAASDDDARQFANQIGVAITELRQVPAPDPAPAPNSPAEDQPLAVTPEFTFFNALDYSYCLEDVIQLYLDPQRLQTQGRRSNCLEPIFAAYPNGISRSQALTIITAADRYATGSARDTILYPPRGQRVRIQEIFGFTYAIDQP